MIRIFALFLLLLCACKTVPKVKPKPITKDHFFIFGGGYSATGNQVSLEKNVNYLNAVLEAHRPASKYILFADGNNGGRSLQYRVNSGFPDQFQKMLIYCLGTTKRISDYYRPHKLQTQGQLKKVEIEKYFRDVGTSIKKDERLFVYYTGHGGKGDKKDPQNTGLYLWHDGIYRMRDFAKRLQTVPPDVPVVCVMVQCYSGGFQNIIFKEGDPKKGLTANNLCGFYATVYNRLAAGCTPEINEENYQEYSTWFWAALTGRNRLGFKILKPDYNGDGRTSFDEAHAYTLINLRSIDIPTKTSELLLRQYTPKTFSKSLGISQKSSLLQYLKAAEPSSSAVIEQLVKQSGSNMNWTIGNVLKEAETLAKKIAGIKKQNESLLKEIKKLRPKVAGRIRFFYPELGNPHHPATHEILVHEKENLKNLLDKEKDFLSFKEKYMKYQVNKEEASKIEKKWVILRRLSRTLENVLYEPYFLQSVPVEIKNRYLQMRKLEQSFF